MHRYRFPALSGIALALVFYPLYIWPLALVALTPFFYFAGQAHILRKHLFWGGFLTAVLAVTPTLYFSLFQLVAQPGAPLLTLAVRASSIFFFFFIGGLFGTLAVLYRAFRTKNLLFNSLFGAALYCVVEFILFAAFGGYYYASVAQALAPFPPALLLAAWGGVPFVIFCVAWFNAALAQKSWRLVVGVLIFLAIMSGTQWGVAQRQGSEGEISVAIIQPSSNVLATLAAPAPVPFADSPLQTLIASAAQSAELVVYPFSPVEAAYEGVQPSIPGLYDLASQETLGAWLGSFAPASTTVMLWDTVAEHGNLYDGFDFWQDGSVQEYQKTHLYALSDYTPAWLRALGLAHQPFELTPGSVMMPVSIDGVSVGGLACSELQQESYVRAQAGRSDLLLSVGSDSFFPGDLASNWSVEDARFRAAENGTPLVRGYVFGPSAIINADGSVAAEMPAGATGILRAEVAIKKITTVYARFGTVPTYALILLILGWALYRRFISPYSADR